MGGFFRGAFITPVHRLPKKSMRRVFVVACIAREEELIAGKPAFAGRDVGKKTPRGSRRFQVGLSAQVFAQQGMVELSVAENPHHSVVVLQHQFVAGLVADLQGVAHADIGVHQGR